MSEKKPMHKLKVNVIKASDFSKIYNLVCKYHVQLVTGDGLVINEHSMMSALLQVKDWRDVYVQSEDVLPCEFTEFQVDPD